VILVLDFGGQYAQLIARRVRECRVYSELIPYDTPVEEILAREPEGIILSGGPNSVYGEGAPRVDNRLFELGTPALGSVTGCSSWRWRWAVRSEPSRSGSTGALTCT